MKIFSYKDKNYISKIENFINKRNQLNSENNKIEKEVRNIIKEVRFKGDNALIKFSKKFDGIHLKKSTIKLSSTYLSNYKKQIDINILNSFKKAIKNVKNFHKKQLPKNYKIRKNNIEIGSVWKSIESVGLYIPGGSSVYPSSLIMNVIPAQVAGVKRIVVTTPSQNDKFNPYMLALFDLLKIKEVYQIGGAQAIAALAYGTKTVLPVNKIFGPGNAYVTSAKKNVFGKVGIDLMAGPSEIVVVADNKNNPEWVASDMLAQAEHDENAQSILITNSFLFSKKVIEKINKLIVKISKKKIVKKSLKNFGAIIVLKNLNTSSSIINLISPEHLHLHNKSRESIVKKVYNAGAIFIGDHTSESFGDYIVGTNHVLPTSGSARFSSGLGVLDFMKRTSYVKMNKKSSNILADHVINMASIENLDAHKLSVKVRQKQKK